MFEGVSARLMLCTELFNDALDKLLLPRKGLLAVVYGLIKGFGFAEGSDGFMRIDEVGAF